MPVVLRSQLRPRKIRPPLICTKQCRVANTPRRATKLKHLLKVKATPLLPLKAKAMLPLQLKVTPLLQLKPKLPLLLKVTLQQLRLKANPSLSNLQSDC